MTATIVICTLEGFSILSVYDAGVKPKQEVAVASSCGWFVARVWNQLWLGAEVERYCHLVCRGQRGHQVHNTNIVGPRKLTSCVRKSYSRVLAATPVT